MNEPVVWFTIIITFFFCEFSGFFVFQTVPRELFPNLMIPHRLPKFLSSASVDLSGLSQPQQCVADYSLRCRFAQLAHFAQTQTLNPIRYQDPEKRPGQASVEEVAKLGNLFVEMRAHFIPQS